VLGLTCPSVSRITPPWSSKSKRRSHFITSKVYLISSLYPLLGFTKEHEMGLSLGFSTHSATQISLPSSSSSSSSKKCTWCFSLSSLALSQNRLEGGHGFIFAQGRAEGGLPHFTFVHTHALPSLCSTALCRQDTNGASRIRPPPRLYAASSSDQIHKLNKARLKRNKFRYPDPW
jgi:hypothetical protein